MRILAISDVVRWDGYEDVLRQTHPDVVALAGDLVNDGWAGLHSRTWDLVPQFRTGQKILMKRLGISGSGGAYRSAREFPEETFPKRLHQLSTRLDQLKEKLEGTREFAKARWRLHVGKFYKFLKSAGRIASVLVISGDHDSEFPNDYRIDKINSIPGCSEITGRCMTLSGIKFLGLGFDQTHYRRQMRNYVTDYSDRVGVVIAHSEQSAMPLVGALNPKLLVRGHFGSGKYLVSGVPSVFTADVHHTVIDLRLGSLPKIVQYGRYHTAGERFKVVRKGSCKPWFTTESEFERYSWLAPYPHRQANTGIQY